MCTLDALKAFAKVNLLVDLLFKKLFKKHICPLALRLLMNSYCIQKMFTMCNGVKQGGVQSRLLFNIYLEELLTGMSPRVSNTLIT